MTEVAPEKWSSYRMVFAQPRQQELLACLEQAVQTEGSPDRFLQWKIDLTPLAPTADTVFEAKPKSDKEGAH